MKTLPRVLTLVMSLSGLVALPVISQAGFTDSLYSIRNAMSQISSTTNQVRGVKDDVQGMMGAVAPSRTANNGTAGSVLYPKINNISLYQSPNKSGAVLRKLPKGTEMVFSGSASGGFYMVTTEYGEGWVDAKLVQ